MPAGQGLIKGGEVALGHIDEGGGAGSTIEVLVATPDRQVRLTGVEADLVTPGRVTQIPARQATHIVGGCRDRREVPELAGAVVHL